MKCRRKSKRPPEEILHTLARQFDVEGVHYIDTSLTSCKSPTILKYKYPACSNTERFPKRSQVYTTIYLLRKGGRGGVSREETHFL